VDLQGETEAEDHGADDGALSRAVWPDHQIQCGPREHCAIFVSHKVFHPGRRACTRARALISAVPRNGTWLPDAEAAAAAADTARAAVRAAPDALDVSLIHFLDMLGLFFL
jgi:hypothetical protein